MACAVTISEASLDLGRLVAVKIGNVAADEVMPLDKPVVPIIEAAGKDESALGSIGLVGGGT